MAKDFFGSLGETLTKTAKELSGRAEEVYETQRLKNKISGEERQIEKAMADLGRIIYKRYKKEIPVDDAQKALCEQIDQRMEQIEKYKTDISELKVKNKRFCPSCGSPLAKDDAFCSQCGAACPTIEPEEDAGDDVIEGTVNMAPKELEGKSVFLWLESEESGKKRMFQGTWQQQDEDGLYSMLYDTSLSDTSQFRFTIPKMDYPLDDRYEVNIVIRDRDKAVRIQTENHLYDTEAP